GARICSAQDAWGCDIVVKIRAPSMEEIPLMKEGAVLISLIQPAQNKPLLDRLQAQKITVFAMDCIPRISRAQVYDVLSSMANIAGYKAVVEASHHFGRFLNYQSTAAGR